MDSSKVALDLIESIYDAAGDPSKWPACMERLRRATKSATASIYIHDRVNGHGGIAASVGFDPRILGSYEPYYAARNIYLINQRELLFPGNVCISQELCSDEVAQRTEFYSDFILPQKLSTSGWQGVLAVEKSCVSMVGVIRPHGARPYGERDLQLAHALMPHLRRAVQLHQRIVGLESEKAAVHDALNAWSVGVILLDAEQRILLVNRTAEALLASRDGLTIDRGVLSAAAMRENTTLRRLIRGTILTANSTGANGVRREIRDDPGGGLLLSRPSGKRSLHVLVAPAVRNPSLFAMLGAAAIVFVSDPEATPAPRAAVIQRLYGLTPAETKVAALLLEGVSLPAIANALTITLNTAKTHARRVYEKTGTKGQPDFIRATMNGPIILSDILHRHPIG